MQTYDVDTNGKLDYGEFLKLAKVCFYSKENWRESFLVKILFTIVMKMVIYPYTGISAKNLLANSLGLGFVSNVPDPIMAGAVETIFLTANTMR